MKVTCVVLIFIIIIKQQHIGGGSSNQGRWRVLLEAVVLAIKTEKHNAQ